MRPNVEITHTLQGRIKDFAEERDLSLSEAYTELLEAGLDTLETQDQQ
jgi:2-iminoacetate synthase ThiH